MEPAVAETVPGAHGRHAAEPEAVDAEPAGQGEQLAAPALEAAPALHASQPTAPAIALALPAAHNPHSEEPGARE